MSAETVFNSRPAPIYLIVILRSSATEQNITIVGEVIAKCILMCLIRKFSVGASLHCTLFGMERPTVNLFTIIMV